MRWGRRFACVALPALVFLAASVHAATLYGLVDTGEVFASLDEGASWSLVSSLPFSDGVAVVAGADSVKLFAATESGTAFRSDDGGETWSAVGAVTASDVVDLIHTPGRLLVFSSSGTVFSSSDDGESFTPTGAITAPDIVAAVASDDALFAMSRTGSCFRSDDGGSVWAAGGSLRSSRVTGLAAMGASLFAMTAAGDAARSDDAGASWAIVGTLSQVGIMDLIATGTTFFAATEAGEVAASADGTAWTWRGTMNQLTLRGLGHNMPATTGASEPRESSLSLRFGPPWPNPAGGPVHLLLGLDSPARVTVDVFDARGQRVETVIADERFGPGSTQRVWRPDVPAGVYFLQARTAGTGLTRKVTWLGAAR